MRPVLLTLLDQPIPSYAVCVALGWLVGGVAFYRAFRRRSWPLEDMLFVMAGCIVGALFGALLGSLLFVPRAQALEVLHQGHIGVGYTFVGGILGGFAGVELIKKVIGYPHSTGDAFALAIPLGHAIGRVGCLLAGCCFGTPSNLPWAIQYPFGSPAHASQVALGLLSESAATSLSVHPTPLYELAFDLLLLAVLMRLSTRFSARGSLFRAYLLGYGLFRLLLEFVRGDSSVPDGALLKPVQWVLMAMVLLAAVRLVLGERTARGPSPQPSP